MTKQTYIHTYIHYLHTYLPTYLHNIHTYILTYILTYIHTYITYTHTYIHTLLTYIHTLHTLHTLHTIPLHYITSHYIALHYITLHYIIRSCASTTVICSRPWYGLLSSFARPVHLPSPSLLPFPCASFACFVFAGCSSARFPFSVVLPSSIFLEAPVTFYPPLSA